MQAPDLVHPSIAGIPEGALVDQLAGPLWRWIVFEPHGVPRDAIQKTKVQLQSAPGNFHGDIDLLLCAPGRPELAVAYEVKRIKFSISALRSGLPNKLHEFKKAVAQANILAEVGFSQVYLYVIAVVDSREQNLGKTSYAGLSTELQSVVPGVVSLEGLDERVGLFEWEFTQPMDYDPLTVGSSRGHLHRLARAIPQSRELTRWVDHVLL